jgi:hypothetical protein
MGQKFDLPSRIHGSFPSPFSISFHRLLYEPYFYCGTILGDRLELVQSSVSIDRTGDNSSATDGDTMLHPEVSGYQFT